MGHRISNTDLLMRGDSMLGRCTCGIVIGYIASDIVIILLHWEHLGSVAFLVHHFATMIPYLFVLKHGVMMFFAMYRLLAELSTPFVNKRWILETLKYPKSTWSYVLNGILMTGMFFLCRILTIPYWYYMMYRTPRQPGYDHERNYHYYWIAFWSCVILDSLNCVWMVKILRGVAKLLSNVDKNENRVKDD